jgi:hypothetical protein
VAIARRFQPEEGLEGGESPLWDLAGRYAWANVPTVTTEVPPYEVNDSSRHDLTQEDLAQKAGFIITEQESPLGKIAAEIR